MASRADGNRIPASHPPGYAAVFLRVVLIVFMAEFLVMELLGLLPARLVESISARQILLPILDAALLVILIAPPIYFWAIKPYVEGRRAMAGVLAMASHELRTPLNGIAGLIDIAADAPDDPELPGYLKIARQKTAELTAQMDQILCYSRLESGFFKARIATHTLASCMHLPMEAGRKAAWEKGLDFRSNLDEVPADLAVLTDCSLLSILIGHLVDNAVKFTARGDITVRIDVPDTAPGTIRIVVEDNGEGGSRTQVEHLARTFTQRDGAYARSGGGLGLGLTISRHLADLLDCRLDMHSRLEGGTRAVLTVPLASMDVSSPGERPSGV